MTRDGKIPALTIDYFASVSKRIFVKKTATRLTWFIQFVNRAYFVDHSLLQLLDG